jgi:hypothetical protein
MLSLSSPVAMVFDVGDDFIIYQQVAPHIHGVASTSIE